MASGVSARVQEDTAGRLDLSFDDLGEQGLKNIARPVRVYRVRDAASKSPLAFAPSALRLPDKPSIAVLQNLAACTCCSRWDKKSLARSPRSGRRPRASRSATRGLPTRGFNAVLSSIASANGRFSSAFSAFEARSRFVDLSVPRRERQGESVSRAYRQRP